MIRLYLNLISFLKRENSFLKGLSLVELLLTLDISTRQTKDVDCIEPQIPEDILKAADEFAETLKSLKLEKGWLNNGPASLKNQLPSGWQDRVQSVYQGKNLQLDVLGRSDLLITKLYAYCDRTDPDYSDLLKLKPTQKELDKSLPFVKSFDENPSWPEHVEKMFHQLKKALYG